MPRRVNDPRDRPNPQPSVPTGPRRGVGFRLLPGATSFRNVPINQDQHPFGDHRMDDLPPIPLEQSAKRYPDYAQGFNLKSVDQYLVGLWRARRIPGLTPEEHAQFDGIPTAEEWYDVAFSEDRRVINTWAELNATSAFDPATFDISAAYGALDPAGKAVIQGLIQILSSRKS